MRHTEVLIIGQGIAGTLLSYELMRAGKSVLVIDNLNGHNASLVASAVINPLIGKNWTVAKDAGTMIPVAIQTYQALEELLNISVLAQKSLFIFHPDEQSAANFAHQADTQNPYTSFPIAEEINLLGSQWHLQNKIGKVAPVYTVDAALLLQEWRDYLQKRSSFLEEQFSFEELHIQEDTVFYKDIRADKIIFCEGATGRNNPLFSIQNFTTNRGDTLLLSVPGLATESLYQKGIRLVPKGSSLFWCGSNYTWKYDNLEPDVQWRNEITLQLQSWLSIPFEITEHLVAERPTTAGQTPLMLQHSDSRNVYFFNGLGTRGFSAGPALVEQFLDKINRP